MVDFAATWCVPCGELELTFGDDDVYDLITKSFVPLKFDVSDSTAVNAERQARYKAGTLPAVVYLSTDGHTVGRVDHMMEPDELGDGEARRIGPRPLGFTVRTSPEGRRAAGSWSRPKVAQDGEPTALDPQSVADR